MDDAQVSSIVLVYRRRVARLMKDRYSAWRPGTALLCLGAFDYDLPVDRTRDLRADRRFVCRGISSVTYMELLVGCRNKTEQRKVERFVRRFGITKLNETIADRRE